MLGDRMNIARRAGRDKDDRQPRLLRGSDGGPGPGRDATVLAQKGAVQIGGDQTDGGHEPAAP